MKNPFASPIMQGPPKMPAPIRPAPRPAGFNPAGRKAYTAAKEHFGDNEISRAIGQTAHEQGE